MIDLDALGRLPAWLTVSAVAVSAISLAVGIPLARRAGERAARLVRPAPGDQPATRKDRMALFAALAPSVLVWLAVMGVSFIGLTGFAATVMKWNHWTNILVPLSLDGISVSFGGWAFVAVKGGRHPGRAYKIVLAAASVSAMLNFVHGKDVWSIWAGVYLAFLSFAGMAMFHEMLDQFMASYEDDLALKLRYPRFGQRWFYAPWTTWCARRAWVVYPPAEGTRPTISNALQHWSAVRRTARAERMEMYSLRVEEQQTKALASQRLRDARNGQTADGLHLNGTDTSIVPGARDVRDGVAGREMGVPFQRRGSGDRADDDPADSRVRESRRARPRESNTELNAAAEDLWIEAKKDGIDLSSSRLLTLFQQRYPDISRRTRWAVHRRNAARARLSQERELADTVTS